MGGATRAETSDERSGSWTPSDRLTDALRPYLDLERAGPKGLESWLLSVLPVLPELTKRPRPSDEGDLSRRVLELARELSECELRSSRDHFQAAEYFVDNTWLARRVRVLEAVIRTSQRSGKVPNTPVPPPASDPTERYLPGGAPE